MAEPSLSPDRKEVAFVSGGDIWTVPLQGGEARLLLSHAANDSRPLFSPDGKRLAFLSNRDGAANVYVLELASGAVRRLTYSDTGEILDGWSRDSEFVYFSSAAGDVGSTFDIYRVRSEWRNAGKSERGPLCQRVSCRADAGREAAFVCRARVWRDPVVAEGAESSG